MIWPTEWRRLRAPGAGAGFTLIEILVVLAILGFALTLIVGYRQPWSNALGLDGTARELASGLRLARAQAIARDRPVAFTLDLKTHRYRIDAGRPRRLPDKVAVTFLTIRGETARSTQASIRFNPDGSSTGGRISLDEAGRRMAVGVDWLTGRVGVVDAR